MRKLIGCLALLALVVPAGALAGPSDIVTGSYVEARSAQVFIGGCIMNSEAVTVGREAVVAWHIDRGTAGDVSLDGLTLVAAIAGEANLAIQPDAPRRTVLFVDGHAGAEQVDALVELFSRRHGNLFGEVVDVVAAPIEFQTSDGTFRVAAGEAVRVETRPLEVDHGALEGCGDSRWFEPFVALETSSLGLAVEHAYGGDELNIRWSDPDKQSVFYGRFSF